MGIGHPPHIHKYAKLLMVVGTDPEHPVDLGAEVELQMGPEREKHLITEYTVVFIPPNFVHCLYIIRKTAWPWIFMEVKQWPVHTEKLIP